jgi:hypothetical protein
MGLKWPYFAKMTPPKKMPNAPPFAPPKRPTNTPKNKKIPSYSEKKPGQSYGRLFMKNTIVRGYLSLSTYGY